MKLNEIVQRGGSVADLNIEYRGTSFFCQGKQLTSLEGSPKEIAGSFFCGNNQLTSLKGAPIKISQSFYCDNNQLTSLEGAPKEVGGNFNCGNNQLKSLNFSPIKVGSNFYCFNNQLATLENAPKEVGGSFYCNENPITNFKDVHKHINKIKGDFIFAYCPIKSHVLGLLLIEGVTEFSHDDKLLREILNISLKQYPNEPKKRVLCVQKRLLEEHPDGKELAKL